MTLSVQFLTMISMVLGGFYLGLSLDTFRRFSVYWRKKKVLLYFMEISFWLTQTVLLYYLLFRVNSGELRFYVFIACLLGFSMYQVLASTIYQRLLEHLIRIGIGIYQFAKNTFLAIVVAPIIYIVKMLVAIIVFIASILWTIIRYIVTFIFVPVAWVFSALHRLLPKNIRNFLHTVAGFYSKMENIFKKWKKYLTIKRR
ncbi:spore cortex biosynthesis protein YabQ [Virgibacillus kekensis]|uniref:Spore cortex biosynthesis protein YabQ n=1 Tax=Virgibacillus kekensis TaxID=202261 RepID=A0ABV9DJP9_9BACI